MSLPLLSLSSGSAHSPVTIALALAGLVFLLFVGLRLMAGRALRRLEHGARVDAPASGAPPSAVANVERRIAVILAAAVAATEGPRTRILDIRRVQGGNISSQQAWSMEGRREIYLSHRIR